MYQPTLDQDENEAHHKGLARHAAMSLFRWDHQRSTA